MMLRSAALSLLALAAASSASAASGGSPKASQGSLRLACAADGAQDFSMSARFEDRRGRRKFDASFEAAPNLGFVAGQRLAVSVGGVAVGQMTLSRDPANGDVVGDLDFDTRVDERAPFPANFPTVAAGTGVVVGALGCALN